MRAILLLFLVVFGATPVMGQWYWQINFENGPWSSGYLERIVRDTVDNPLCSWQIGTPQKTVFDSAYQSSRAIVTDTANPVRANDTSVFILKHARDNNSLGGHFFALEFQHKMDGDSTDFGKIEVSRDTGHTWINVLTEDTTYGFNWAYNTQKPTLLGSTNGWNFVRLEMVNWANTNIFADTILFRFTYITDSDTIQHDGWMIDDIHLEDWWEGVEDVSQDTLLLIYPNPADEQVRVESKLGGPVTLRVYDGNGKLVLKELSFQTSCEVDTHGLPDGLYFLRWSDKERSGSRKFLVRH